MRRDPLKHWPAPNQSVAHHQAPWRTRAQRLYLANPADTAPGL